MVTKVLDNFIGKISTDFLKSMAFVICRIEYPFKEIFELHRNSYKFYYVKIHKVSRVCQQGIFCELILKVI